MNVVNRKYNVSKYNESVTYVYRKTLEMNRRYSVDQFLPWNRYTCLFENFLRQTFFLLERSRRYSLHWRGRTRYRSRGNNSF